MVSLILTFMGLKPYGICYGILPIPFFQSLLKVEAQPEIQTLVQNRKRTDYKAEAVCEIGYS